MACHAGGLPGQGVNATQRFVGSNALTTSPARQVFGHRCAAGSCEQRAFVVGCATAMLRAKRLLAHSPTFLQRARRTLATIMRIVSCTTLQSRARSPSSGALALDSVVLLGTLTDCFLPLPAVATVPACWRSSAFRWFGWAACGWLPRALTRRLRYAQRQERSAIERVAPASADAHRLTSWRPRVARWRCWVAASSLCAPWRRWAQTAALFARWFAPSSVARPSPIPAAPARRSTVR